MAVGVFLHIHHEHVGSDILDALRRIRGGYRLFVTHSKPLSSEILRKISKTRADPVIHCVENRGRDILPFLTMLNAPEAKGIDVLIKLHTKRTSLPHFDTWSKISYRPLIDPANFRRIARIFGENEKLIMLGTRENYKDGEKFYFENKPVTERVFEDVFQTSVPKNWGFFAGSMFWARRDAFEKLSYLHNSPDMFEPEPIGDNGSVAHGLERIFGILPVIERGYVGTIDALTSEIVILPEVGAPSTSPMSQDWKRIEAAWAQEAARSRLVGPLRHLRPLLARVRRKMFA